MTENNLCTVTGNLIVAKEVFTDGGAEKLLKPLREKLTQFVPDLTTKKSRAEIASFAAKFSKSKTLVDKLGKVLKDEYKVLIDPIDKERKIFRDACDEMRDEARKPLTDWETEQDRIVELERKRVEMELDWDDALAEDDLFNREREMKKKEEAQSKAEAEKLAKEKAERDEKARIDYEAKVKKEADERAIQASEEALLKEQQEKERLILEAHNREKQAKIDAENAEKQRLEDIETEKQRVEKEKLEAAEKAEREKQEALAEQKRQQEASDKLLANNLAKEKEISDRKAANLNHQKSVNRKAVAKLMQVELSGSGNHYLTEDQAFKIASDIVKNPIDEITINY